MRSIAIASVAIAALVAVAQPPPASAADIDMGFDYYTAGDSGKNVVLFDYTMDSATRIGLDNALFAPPEVGAADTNSALVDWPKNQGRAYVDKIAIYYVYELDAGHAADSPIEVGAVPKVSSIFTLIGIEIETNRGDADERPMTLGDRGFMFGNSNSNHLIDDGQTTAA